MSKGRITIFFDRDPIDDQLRVDYNWEDDKGNKYLIEDIPCIKFPIDTKDYWSKEVSLAVSMIAHLQENKEIPNDVSFMDIEEMVDDLSKFV